MLYDSRFVRSLFIFSLPGLRALYHVSFKGDSMHVWRVLSETSERISALNVTLWKEDVALPCSTQKPSTLSKENESFVAYALEELVYEAGEIYSQDMPERVPSQLSIDTLKQATMFSSIMVALFVHDMSKKFTSVVPLLQIMCSSSTPLPLSVAETSLDVSSDEIFGMLSSVLAKVLHMDEFCKISFQEDCSGLGEWLSDTARAHQEFWIGNYVLTLNSFISIYNSAYYIDAKAGHNRITVRLESYA
jgi:hypothetical protein